MSTSGTLTLADLIAGLADEPLALDGLPRVEIRSAVIDSRLAAPGCLFVALPGERRDGHEFIAEAVASGARAIVAERAPEAGLCTVLDTTLEGWQSGLSERDWSKPACLLVPDSLAGLQGLAAFWRRQHDVRVIGITGSIGKTTSKEVIAAILGQRYRTLKSEGNYNNEIGLPLTLLHLTAGHERVVLEMGMYDVGEIAELAEIALPQVGVLTNVGPSHLERLGTIERIAQAKAELPQALPPANEGGVAILNADDEWVKAMANQTQAAVFTYGLTPDATLWADEVESEGLEGIRFRLHYGHDVVHIRVPMLGRHSVHTALRATAAGLVEDLSWAEIIAGLREQSAQLRLVAVAGPAGSTILDDTYNSSPASCLAALTLLNELGDHEAGGRRIAVLGDMYELGSYEEEGHRIVGRRIQGVADILVTVGQLGRIIAEEALETGMTSSTVYSVETNAQAIELLSALIQAGPTGDKILVKGSRGLRMEEIVAALQEGDIK
jgi:UDP-N-acetylmuramoyl-tripeptide--D-alanyl-D-alanine ligase